MPLPSLQGYPNDYNKDTRGLEYMEVFGQFKR